MTQLGMGVSADSYWRPYALCHFGTLLKWRLIKLIHADFITEVSDRTATGWSTAPIGALRLFAPMQTTPPQKNIFSIIVPAIAMATHSRTVRNQTIKHPEKFMTSTNNKDLLPEFESIKDDNEKILWTGKPKFIPFIFTGILGGIFTIAFGVVWLLSVRNLNSNGEKSSPSYFWIFGLIPLTAGLFAFLRKVFSFSNTAYSYSDKRVMMRSGFIGTDFKTIDYDKISDIEVTVSIVEKIYNVGTIRFFSGRTQSDEGNITKLYDSWTAIENPYEVFKMVKQTAVNIKTDFSYPNALRPDTNPGYNTKYQPEK